MSNLDLDVRVPKGEMFWAYHIVGKFVVVPPYKRGAKIPVNGSFLGASVIWQLDIVPRAQHAHPRAVETKDP